MNTRGGTPQRSDEFGRNMDKEVEIATSAVSEPAAFDSQMYHPNSRALHPQETGTLDAVAFGVAIAITLGPLLAYSLGYGA